MSNLLGMRKEIQELMLREEWGLASKKCTQLQQKFTNIPFGYIQGGICLRELGNIIEALGLFDVAIDMFQSIPQPLIHKANILIEQKKFQAASNICEKLRLEFPETPFGFIQGGICQNELGELEKAVIIWCSFTHKKSLVCIGNVLASKNISPEIFQLSINTLLMEKFTLVNSTILVNVVYRLYFSNLSAYEKIYIYLKSIKEKIDSFTKIALGFDIDDTQLLDEAYSSGSLDIIKKVFSSHPNHKNNVDYLRQNMGHIKHTNSIVKEHFINRFNTCSTIDHKSAHKKLKIAVCISGQARGFELASKTWPESFNKQHDFDFYCCLWNDMGRKGLVRAHLDRYFDNDFCQIFLNDTEGLSKEATSDKYKNLYALFTGANELVTTTVESIYSPTKIDIVDTGGFSEESNMYCMHYMIERCWKLIDDPTAYDLIIRIRPDKSINKNNINWNAIYDKCKKGYIISDEAVSMHPSVGLVIGDQVAMSTPEIMREYSTTFSKIKNESDIFSKYPGYRSHMSLSLSVLEKKIKVSSASDHITWGPLIDTVRLDNKTILEALNKDRAKGIPFTDFEAILN
jgi:tetratricopeptide (TPR) repeat protein